MNGLSLCSGVGGIDLGLRLAVPGYRTVCCVEIEAFPQDVLLARMADGKLDPAPVWGDLKQFDGTQWRGLVDVVHGGYPCQPFSVAGKRLGEKDPRHLWPDIARIIRECEPEWCFFENVAGHLRLGFDVVACDLVEMGYRVAAGLFTAAEVGAPHRRQRVFILAHRCSAGRSEIAGSAPRNEETDGRAGRDTRESDGYYVADGVHEAVGDAERVGWYERSVEVVSKRDGRWGATAESGRCGVWPPGPSERDRWDAVLAERPDLAPAVADSRHIQPKESSSSDGVNKEWSPERGREQQHAGFGAGSGTPGRDISARPPDARIDGPDGACLSSGVTRRAGTEISPEPVVRRVADGSPRRVDRLKALGNGVVPSVAALAWRTLHEELGA